MWALVNGNSTNCGYMKRATLSHDGSANHLVAGVLRSAVNLNELTLNDFEGLAVIYSTENLPSSCSSSRRATSAFRERLRMSTYTGT